MIKTCKWCGKEYETNLYWWLFCCDECYKAYSEERSSRLIKCEICGDEFHPSSSRAKYCSDTCRKIAQAKQIKQWNKDHHEELMEKQRQLRKDHPEITRKYNRKNYYKHLEQRREYARNYSKNYYYSHRKKILAYQKDHREEKRLADRRRYWEKKIKVCEAEHEGCLSCPTLDGKCLFD